MTFRLSTGISNALLFGSYGSGGLLGQFPALLEEARSAFEKGDRWQLWDVLQYCALFQLTVPDWAVDALLDINVRLEDGEYRDLNEAIGKPHLSQQQRRRQAIQRKYAGEVIRLAYKMRDEDGMTLNSESRELIAKKVGGLSGKDVQDILRAHAGAGLKHKPRGKNEGYAIVNASIPLTTFRRRGRPLAQDPTAVDTLDA